MAPLDSRNAFSRSEKPRGRSLRERALQSRIVTTEPSRQVNLTKTPTRFRIMASARMVSTGWNYPEHGSVSFVHFQVMNRNCSGHAKEHFNMGLLFKCALWSVPLWTLALFGTGIVVRAIAGRPFLNNLTAILLLLLWLTGFVMIPYLVARPALVRYGKRLDCCGRIAPASSRRTTRKCRYCGSTDEYI